MQSSSCALTGMTPDLHSAGTSSWNISPASLPAEASQAPALPAVAPTATSQSVSDESSSNASSPAAGAGDHLAHLLGSKIWQGDDVVSPSPIANDGVHRLKQSQHHKCAVASVSKTPTAFMTHKTHDSTLDVTLDDALFGGDPATSPNTSNSVSGIASSPIHSQGADHGARHSAGHSPSHSDIGGTNASRSELNVHQHPHSIP